MENGAAILQVGEAHFSFLDPGYGYLREVGRGSVAKAAVCPSRSEFSTTR